MKRKKKKRHFQVENGVLPSLLGPVVINGTRFERSLAPILLVCLCLCGFTWKNSRLFRSVALRARQQTTRLNQNYTSTNRKTIVLETFPKLALNTFKKCHLLVAKRNPRTKKNIIKQPTGHIKERKKKNYDSSTTTTTTVYSKFD